MLSVALDRLTTLTSKHFIVGAFVPVLVFALLNGLVLYAEFDWFQSWASPQIAATGRVFDAAAVALGLAVCAYVLWSINSFLRQILEGRSLMPEWLKRRLRAHQAELLRARRKDHRNAWISVSRIKDEKRKWNDDLVAAGVEGNTKHRGVNNYDGINGPAAAAMDKLRQHREDAKAPEVSDLVDSVDKLRDVLSKNDVAAINPTAKRLTLSDDQRELLSLADYAEDEWVAREVACAAVLQTRFGTEAAPTTMGNVAASMEGYALSRYRMNLATVWNRLQPVLQKQSDFYGVLQDAKTQLDFLVACIWLTAITTAVWVVVLPLWTHTVWLFLIVAIGGPALARFLYLIALENYVAFGSIVCTGIDLYRFELLDALRIPKPSRLLDERATWEALQHVTSFGVEWIDLSYRHPPEPPK
jgi:hypothetical protein